MFLIQVGSLEITRGNSRNRKCECVGFHGMIQVVQRKIHDVKEALNYIFNVLLIVTNLHKTFHRFQLFVSFLWTTDLLLLFTDTRIILATLQGKALKILLQTV